MKAIHPRIIGMMLTATTDHDAKLAHVLQGRILAPQHLDIRIPGRAHRFMAKQRGTVCIAVLALQVGSWATFNFNMAHRDGPS